MKGIKTVIFDLGGVLMDLDKQACIDAFRKLGYEHVEELLDAYSQKGAFLQLEAGQISVDKFHDEVRRAIGKPVTDKQIDDAFLKFLVDIPDYKLDMLLDLKKEYQVFMLSNTNPIMMDWMKNHSFRKQGLTIEDYFDRLFLSYEMGVTKPHEEIYRKVIEDSGINPAEALFIDDSEKNVAAARSLGFHTYQAAPQEDYRAIFRK